MRKILFTTFANEDFPRQLIVTLSLFINVLFFLSFFFFLYTHHQQCDPIFTNETDIYIIVSNFKNAMKKKIEIREEEERRESLAKNVGLWNDLDHVSFLHF